MSLVNSFERLAKFCRQKLEEIEAKEQEDLRPQPSASESLNSNNILDDIDKESEKKETPVLEVFEDEKQNEGEEEEDESMSLKDVIMTLNDFYSAKLEGLHKAMTSPGLPKEEIEAIEKTVKDNEVRIPYDEDIFVGIDKNYKILKKILNIVKDQKGKGMVNF